MTFALFIRVRNVTLYSRVWLLYEWGSWRDNHPEVYEYIMYIIHPPYDAVLLYNILLHLNFLKFTSRKFPSSSLPEVRARVIVSAGHD